MNIVVGGDRVKEFDKLSTEYNGKLYNFNKVKLYQQVIEMQMLKV